MLQLAEEWIKEGKYALNLTRLVRCKVPVANRVRLSVFVLAYNLGNFLRRLCLPKAVNALVAAERRQVEMGGRLVLHSRLLVFQLSESDLDGCSREFGTYRPVIAGAKLREGTTTILPRRRALQGVGLSSVQPSSHWRGT